MSLAKIVLQTEDLPKVPFPCPEWPAADGKLFLRVLAGMERMEWEECFVAPEKRTLPLPTADPRALAVGRAMVDEHGGQVFNDEEIALLSRKNAAVLDRAYDAVLRLSGIRKSAKQAEDDRKNSAKTPGGGSSSG
jgi:hypothetical protein